MGATATTEESEFLVEGQLGRLVEGLDDRGRRKQEVWVDLIREGFGNRRDKHYYPAEALQAAAKLFEGAKMYVNHLDPEAQRRLNGMPRDVQDLAGRIREVKMGINAEGIPALQGRVSVSAPWLWQLVEHDPDLIGVSINARGSSRPGRVDGQEAKIVEGINNVGSVDWVTEAGAGGKVVSLVEAQLRDEGRGDEIMGIETLSEADEQMLEARAGDVVTHGGKRKRVRGISEGMVAFEDGTSASVEEVREGMIEARTRAHAQRRSGGIIDADLVDPGLVDPHVAMHDGDAQRARRGGRGRGGVRSDMKDRSGGPKGDWQPYGFDGADGAGYDPQRLAGYTPQELGRGSATAMRSRHAEGDYYDDFEGLEELDMDELDQEAAAISEAELDDFEEASHHAMARKHRHAARLARRRGHHNKAEKHMERARHHERAMREGEFDDEDELEFDDFGEARKMGRSRHHAMARRHRERARVEHGRGRHEKARKHEKRAEDHERHARMREGGEALDDLDLDLMEGGFEDFSEGAYGDEDLEDEGYTEADFDARVEARAREIAREHLNEAVGRAVDTLQAEHDREIEALTSQTSRTVESGEQRRAVAGIIESSALPDASKAALKSELYDAFYEAETDEDGNEVKSAHDVLTEAVQARVDARAAELSVFTEARASDFGPTASSQGGRTQSAPKVAPTATKMKGILFADQ